MQSWYSYVHTRGYFSAFFSATQIHYYYTSCMKNEKIRMQFCKFDLLIPALSPGGRGYRVSFLPYGIYSKYANL